MVEWELNLGGSKQDWSHRVIHTSDDHYLIVGSSKSDDGDIGQNSGGTDGVIIKIATDGEVVWKKVMGGSGEDFLFTVEEEVDGNFIILGRTSSVDGEVPSLGETDIWLMKIDKDGELLWEKRYGGEKNDTGLDLDLTEDGGYIIAGRTRSPIAGNELSNFDDWYMLKLDTNGDIEWERVYGGSKDDLAYSVEQISTGGYIVSGRTSSTDGDVSSNVAGENYWIIRIDPDGELIWDISYATNDDTFDISITTADDGDAVVLAGTSVSEDFLVFKLTLEGDIVWENTFGGSAIERAYHITNTMDGGFLVGGQANSSNGDLNVNYGGRDCWVVKIDAEGDLEWQKSFGGSMNDNVTDMDEINENCYIISNASESSDFDVSGNNGEFDIWVVKLCDEASAVINVTNEAKGFIIYPNPTKGMVTIENQLSKNTDYEILTVYGQMVMQGTMNAHQDQIDLSLLPASAYVLKVGKYRIGVVKID